jgi:hypothetical protein
MLLENTLLNVEKQKFYFFSTKDTHQKLVWHWSSVGFESLKEAEVCHKNLPAFIFYVQGNSMSSF